MNTEINTTPVEEVKQKVRKIKKPKEVKVEEEVEEKVEEKEVKDEDNVDEAIEATEKIIKDAQEKATQLRLKKQLTEKAPEFLEKIAEKKKQAMKRLEEQKLAIETQIEELEKEIETIDEVEEDDIGNFLAINYADEVNVFLAEIYPEFNKKTETKKKTGTTTTRAKYDRDADFAQLPVGLELIISNKGLSATYIKTATGVERNGIAYSSLNKAGKAFYEENKVMRANFNAWTEFKVMRGNKKVCLGDSID